VILTEEDFEKLPLPSKHTIELTQFVEAAEIDPVYYEKTYYLEADERAMKPYALL
jgi:DNA end-binding protein Ku